MQRLKWMRGLILAMAVALPLIWCGASFGESGCHRGEGGGSTKVEPPKP